ncbi:AAA family ATPase [Treponema pectinovorum]|uniref:AAA family ATPase n=1 Tax=Treponema pectinovorum TaxID=164 RepID=UPI0011F1EA94|nr:AAA family ATPase [Treponema pectinovorum]
MADSDIVDINIKIEKTPLFSVTPQVTRNGLPVPTNTVIQVADVINFYTKHKRNSDIPVHLKAEESAGTIQIFNLLLLLLDVCKNRKTLILDNFDASLHTKLAQFILDMVNASKFAQFFFTSHNTNLLDIKKNEKRPSSFYKQKRRWFIRSLFIV